MYSIVSGVANITALKARLGKWKKCTHYTLMSVIVQSARLAFSRSRHTTREQPSSTSPP